jgi:WD40 repeat protein
MPLWLYGAPRSALAAVYPDRVLTHHLDEEERVFVLCPCGAWGEPASLAWMGDVCGPCHDGRAAGQPPRHAWPLAARDSARTVAVAPGGWALAALHEQDGSVTMWDMQTGTQTGYFPVGRGHDTLRLSPDGRLLGARKIEAGQGTLDVFEVATGRQLARLSLPPSSFSFDRDGTLYCHGSDGRLLCWSAPDGDWRALPARPQQPFALSPDGGRTASLVSGAGAVRLLDTRTGRQISEHRLPGLAASQPGFAPDGRVFMIVCPRSWQGPATLFDVLAERETEVRGPWPSCMTSGALTFSPNGRAVAESAAAELLAWPLPDADGRPTFAGTFEAKDTSVAGFLPDGRLLRFDWRSGAVNLWPAGLFGS